MWLSFHKNITPCYISLFSFVDSKSEGQSLDTTHALLQTQAAQSEEETDVSDSLVLALLLSAFIAHDGGSISVTNSV